MTESSRLDIIAPTNEKDYIMINKVTAKLLARENISISITNVKTAAFDVESRTLYLPNWNTDANHMDRLMAHEVAHALYTPASGWHDAIVTFPNAPRAYINIIEDVRIERLIQKLYPGYIRVFSEDFVYVAESGMLGVNQLTSSEVLMSKKLIDKINIMSKSNIVIQLTSEEEALWNKANAAETFDEVVVLSREIYLFDKANKAEEDKNEDDDSDSSENDDAGSSEAPQDNFRDEDEEDSSEQQSSGSADDESDDESPENDPASTDGSGDDDAETDQDSDKKSSESTTSNEKSSESTESDESVESQDSWDVNTESAVDSTPILAANRLSSTGYTHGDIIASGEKFLHATTSLNPYSKLGRYMADVNIGPRLQAHEEKYAESISKNAKLVHAMSEHFTRVKKAKEYANTQTRKTGKLDTKLMHKYQIVEDIFQKKIMTQTGQNHGMVFLLDFSGSMSGMIHDVLLQTKVLTDFCRLQEIPFAVYGFTSTIPKEEYHGFYNSNVGTNLMELINSNINRREYEHAYKILSSTLYVQDWLSVREIYNNVLDDDIYDLIPKTLLGTTPTVQALLLLETELSKLNKAWNIEKLSLTILSDGQPDRNFYQTHTQLADGTIFKNSANQFRLIEAIKKHYDLVVNFIHLETPGSSTSILAAKRSLTLSAGRLMQRRLSKTEIYDLAKEYVDLGIVTLDHPSVDSLVIMSATSSSTMNDAADPTHATPAHLKKYMMAQASKNKAPKTFADLFVKSIA